MTGLTPGRTYTVNVWAINAVGFSAALTRSLTTLTLSVPSAPRSVAVDSVTSTTARVSWLAPLSDGNSPLEGYRVTLTYITAPASPQPGQPKC